MVEHSHINKIIARAYPRERIRLFRLRKRRRTILFLFACQFLDKFLIPFWRVRLKDGHIHSVRLVQALGVRVPKTVVVGLIYRATADNLILVAGAVAFVFGVQLPCADTAYNSLANGIIVGFQRRISAVVSQVQAVDDIGAILARSALRLEVNLNRV